MKQCKITNIKLFVTRIILVVLILAVIMLSVLSFSGCSATAVKDETFSTKNLGFESVISYYNIGEETTYTYLREKLTNTIYLMVEEDSSVGGFDGTSGITIMIDPNTGGPMMYEEFVKYIKNSEA